MQMQPAIRRKRRRSDSHEEPAEASQDSTTTVPAKTHDGGKKATRAKSGSRPPTLRRHSSAANVVKSDIPWTEHFKYLAHLHRALNLVYTFCCTRKHFATTWNNIKSTVEGHIMRPLVEEDVAQVKALIPRAIHFAYIDEESLLVTVAGEGDDTHGAGRVDRLGTEEQKQALSTGESKEVLLFEFIDGDLRREVRDPKTGEVVKARQKLRNEELKMPVFSQKTMLKLIEKRNAKFTSAVNAFLNTCAEDGIDAEARIRELGKQNVPYPSTSRQSTPKAVNGGRPKQIPKERKSIPEIVKDLTQQDWYTGQIVPDGHRVFEPQPAIYGQLKFALSQDLVNALYNTRGITQFYSHQAEAINNVYDGDSVIVSTSTSSGKSLIYQVPMLHELEHDRASRGMYIFPTKALAQDQRRSMRELLTFLPGLGDVMVETFDGDTPMAERNQIRDEARIIFTNPDMLHITILPQENSWRHFLKNLKFVVVDELHVYNGLFGAHVAFIMRRLRRICAAVGNRRVKFISCSATVRNPEEHMKTIFGLDTVKLTDFDGSPSGRKEFVCWNTPFKDAGDATSGRGNAFYETARLLAELMLRGVRVIAFVRIRKQCEVLLAAVKAYFHQVERPECAALVMGYRGGYSAADRRKIEAEMFAGKLMGIVATTALELGVDIGSLDAVVTMGFPYTIANLRQQSGRAGRRNRDSLSMLVGDCFPVDQHFMAHPDELFTKENCELQVDLGNELVAEGHIQCAAYEMPIQPDEDIKFLGKQLPEICRGRLTLDPLGFYHCHPRFRPLPSRCVCIRDTEDETFAVIDITHGRNMVLEEVEASRAFFTLYEGGIFLHQGRTYMIKEFSPERKMARVQLVKVDWTTQQRDFTDIDPVETEQVRRVSANSTTRAYFGRIKVHAVVFGFFKLDARRRILDAVAVDNPPIDIYSKGLWLDVPRFAMDILKHKRLNLAAAIHAAEHAVMSLMPQFVVSMPGDVRTECKNAIKEFAKKETQRKRPARLTFYDAKGGQGGCGIAAKAFEFIDSLLERAVERVTACHCVEGCTECICDERCKEKNMIMSKAGAGVVLKSLIGADIDVDGLPEGEEERVPAGVETVLEATEVMGANGRRVEELPFVKRERSDEEMIIIPHDAGKGSQSPCPSFSPIAHAPPTTLNRGRCSRGESDEQASMLARTFITRHVAAPAIGQLKGSSRRGRRGVDRLFGSRTPVFARARPLIFEGRNTQDSEETTLNGRVLRGVTNGDDAIITALGGNFLVVNDGVGAWAQKERGHAALWSRLIAHFWAEELPLADLDVVGCLQRAFEHTKSVTTGTNKILGTTTAASALLYHEGGKPVVLATNLGDCAVMVVRPGKDELVYKTEEQWHWFDCPRQLGTNSPDTPDANAVMDKVAIEEGDVVLVVSDGLTDNLWEPEIVARTTELMQKWRDGDHEARDGAVYVARGLMEAAKEVALDPTGESPYMERALDEGLAISEGGKIDDISVVVGVCRKRQQN
ncbi:hypothetical protein DV737_g3261, partial [Chaetothyriales sp. CBS 132003]